MTRIILAVGCNSYENLKSLSAAERDAKRIYELLCGAGRYSYDKDDSILLLSPTTTEMNGALVRLFEARPTDVLIYFAGHSESRDGRLFLKFKETQDSVLPFTALGFGELIDKVTQLPSLERLNVILDSCNAGGMLSDIAGLLSDSAKLSAGNASVSILAASDATGAARENASGGYLTTQLAKALDGSSVVQRWSPFLELSQVSEFARLTKGVSDQNSSYWGMNVRGPNPLCQNPSYDPALGAIALPETYFGSSVTLSDAQLGAVRTFLSRVRADGYSPSLLRPVSKALSSLSPNEQITVFLGLSETLNVNKSILPRLSPPEGILMLIQALLPLTDDKYVRSILSFHSQKLPKEMMGQLMSVREQLVRDPMHLVKARPSATWARFYTLPIELVDMLGWIGFCCSFGKPDQSEERGLRELIGLLLRHYGGSLVAIDDRQAPGIWSFYIGSRTMKWDQEAEDVLALLFHDVWTTGGRIARSDAKADDKLRFIVGRNNPLEDLSQVLQSPSDLLGAILICGALSGLDQFWDALLHNLDRKHINLFVSSQYAEYGDHRITDGQNITLRVGEDFWSLFDLRHLVRIILDDWKGADEEITQEAAAISLFFGDRYCVPHLLGCLARNTFGYIVPWVRLRAVDEAGGGPVVLFEKGT